MMMFVRVFLLDFICFFSLIQLLFTTFCSMLSLLLLTFKVGKHFFFWSSLLFFLNQALWFRRVLLFLIGFHFFLLVCLFICDCFRIWSKWKNLVFISSSCCCCLIVTISLRFFPFYFFTQNPEYEIFYALNILRNCKVVVAIFNYSILLTIKDGKKFFFALKMKIEILLSVFNLGFLLSFHINIFTLCQVHTLIEYCLFSLTLSLYRYYISVFKIQLRKLKWINKWYQVLKTLSINISLMMCRFFVFFSKKWASINVVDGIHLAIWNERNE